MAVVVEQVLTIDQLHQQVMEHRVAELQVVLFLQAVVQTEQLTIMD
tara:strand:+ start:189 stop:326 length:138 start_codon:yes stop_codon:yes gene_type:complete